MTEENFQGQNKSTSGNFQAEFNALPLEEKFTQLFRMELATLSEAAKCVADVSMKVFEQVGRAISDFGTKVQTEAHKAADVNAEAPVEPPHAATPNDPTPGTENHPSAPNF